MRTLPELQYESSYVEGGTLYVLVSPMHTAAATCAKFARVQKGVGGL